MKIVTIGVLLISFIVLMTSFTIHIALASGSSAGSTSTDGQSSSGAGSLPNSGSGSATSTGTGPSVSAGGQLAICLFEDSETIVVGGACSGTNPG